MLSILRVVAIGLIVLLTACGGQPTTSSAPQPTQPAAPTQPPEPTAAPQPTQEPVIKVTPGTTPDSNAQLGDVLVIFQRSGGIAGIDETLTVYTDGRIELSDRKGKMTAKVTTDELAALQKLLAGPEFAALDPKYQAAGADLFTYKVTVPGGKKPRTVVTMDGAPTPEVLNQVLVELGKLRMQVK
jgi:glucose/arabinose dehydrogenase